MRNSCGISLAIFSQSKAKQQHIIWSTSLFRCIVGNSVAVTFNVQPMKSTHEMQQSKELSSSQILLPYNLMMLPNYDVKIEDTKCTINPMSVDFLLISPTLPNTLYQKNLA